MECAVPQWSSDENDREKFVRVLMEVGALDTVVCDKWGIDRRRFELLQSECTSQRELVEKLVDNDLSGMSMESLAARLQEGTILRDSLERLTYTIVEEHSHAVEDHFSVAYLAIQMTNVTCTFSCGVPLELPKVSTLLGCQYEPSKFAAAVHKSNDAGLTFLIFPDGKVACNGAKTEAAALSASRLLVTRLQQMGWAAEMSGFEANNFVAKAVIDHKLDLARIAEEIDEATYDPKLFPGAILKLRDPKVAGLIFSHGRIVISGARSRELVIAGAQRLADLLPAYFVDT